MQQSMKSYWQSLLNSSRTLLHMTLTQLFSPLYQMQFSKTRFTSYRKSQNFRYQLEFNFSLIVPKSIGCLMMSKQSGIFNFLGSTGSWNIHAELCFHKFVNIRFAALSQHSYIGAFSGASGISKVSIDTGGSEFSSTQKYLASSGCSSQNLAHSSSLIGSY